MRISSYCGKAGEGRPDRRPSALGDGQRGADTERTANEVLKERGLGEFAQANGLGWGVAPSLKQSASTTVVLRRSAERQAGCSRFARGTPSRSLRRRWSASARKVISAVEAGRPDLPEGPPRKGLRGFDHQMEAQAL